MDDTPHPDGFVSSRQRGTGRSAWFRLLCQLGGVRMAASLIGTLAAVVAAATVYERAYGAQVAAVMVYQSWWLAALFALLGACIIAAVAVRVPLRRHQYGFAVVHLGLLVLMGGFWAHGHQRLDGMLEAPPGAEAARIELPHDDLAVIDGERRSHAAFQPIRDAGYPSLARFIFADFWLGPAAAIHNLPRPRRLIADGTLAVDLTAVLDTGASELGFAPGDGGPAALLTLTAITADGGDSATRAWLSPRGETVIDHGPVVASLMVAGSPHLADGFASPIAPASADGELVIGLADRAVRIPAAPGAVHELAPDLALRVERVITNPRHQDGTLVQDPGARIDPVVEYSLGRGPANERAWTRRFAAALLVAPGGDGFPEVLYAHPLAYVPGQGQGAYVQMLAVPDAGGRRLLLRWFTRSRGFAGAAAIDAAQAPLATWSGDLVGTAGGPMRLNARIDWLPRAVPAPEPVDMLPGKQDRARRWARFRFSDGAATAERWLARDDVAAVELGGRTVFASYRRAVYDLRERHGFAVRLDRFDEGKDPGGMRSASFSSDVTIMPADDKPYAATITMNQPLQHAGVTLYQTAFRPELDAHGRPTGRSVSIFTAATDPGRVAKYLGSLLVVAGIIMLYLMRRRPA